MTDSSDEHEGEFALKLLLDARRSPRLDLEINTTKSLHQSGGPVLHIIDDYLVSDPDTDRPWFVTPIADGGDLRSQITQGEYFRGSLTTALEAFGTIHECVAFLHRSGIAHRDLKPSNILIHEEQFLLADLGLCLALNADLDQSRLTQTLERIGSVNYIPPEAFGRQDISRDQYAFDAYALGKILYELIAGVVLPGFVSPDDPEFSLTTRDARPVTVATNQIVRSLLHERPELRIGILDTLDASIKELINWSREEPKDESHDRRDRLVFAGEALSKKLASIPSIPPQEDSPIKPIIEQLHDALQNSRALAELRAALIDQHPEAVELSVVKSDVVHDALSGPFVVTHKGLEPLQDLGFPQWPEAREGCGVKFAPKSPGLLKKIPRLTAGLLVATKNETLHVAAAVVEQQPGDRGAADVVLETATAFQGEATDPTVLKRALETMEVTIDSFVDLVAARAGE